MVNHIEDIRYIMRTLERRWRGIKSRQSCLTCLVTWCWCQVKLCAVNLVVISKFFNPGPNIKQNRASVQALTAANGGLANIFESAANGG